MSIREKGKAYERKLVKLLQNYGWKSRRVPASILDVIATKNDRIVVFEVKATKLKKNKFKI
jgi:Holliday junction resolvase